MELQEKILLFLLCLLVSLATRLHLQFPAGGRIAKDKSHDDVRAGDRCEHIKVFNRGVLE